MSVVTVRDANEKQRLHEELRSKLADLSVVADAVVGAALSTVGKGGVSMEDRLDSQMERIRAALDEESLTGGARGCAGDAAWSGDSLASYGYAGRNHRCRGIDSVFTGHSPFPEVFLGSTSARIGFDAIVGNPTILGWRRDTGRRHSAICVSKDFMKWLDSWRNAGFKIDLSVVLPSALLCSSYTEGSGCISACFGSTAVCRGPIPYLWLPSTSSYAGRPLDHRSGHVKGRPWPGDCEGL